MSNVERFSNRVEDYAKYRPRYPEALADFLVDFGLGPGAHVRDAGSGTGLFSELLLSRGATVYAVEPNAGMRGEAEQRFATNQKFISINKSAEATSLPSATFDLITAAQSFHWFDAGAAKHDWTRILKPKGWVALLWNERDDNHPVTRAYGELARAFVEKDKAVRRLSNPEAEIDSFFAPNAVQRHTFPNLQNLDREAIIGRALSSSYWPKEGIEFEQSVARLNQVFDEHQTDGFVTFPYITELFLGQL
ncbi:MAG: class I SAM-dependent methyltransferase [Fimbriimonadaceae bacterium]